MRSRRYEVFYRALVTAFLGGVLRLWDLTADEPRERVEPKGHVGRLEGMILAPDGRTMATLAGYDRVMRLWDLSGSAPRQRAEIPHERAVLSVDFSPDGKTLASSDNPDQVRIWDLKGAELEVRSKFNPGGFIQAINFTSEGKALACYDDKGKNIRLWDLSGAEPKERSVLPDCRSPLASSPDGKTLACVRTDRDGKQGASLWDLGGTEPKEPVTLTRSEKETVSSLAWTTDGAALAVSYPKINTKVTAIVLWDLGGKKPRERTVISCGHTVRFLAIAADGKHLATADPHGEVVLWDVTNRANPERRTWRLPAAVGGVTFAQDARHLILANANGTAYVLRLSD